MIKKKLAKKMRQNRPIPHWIRMRTDNTIRSFSLLSLQNSPVVSVIDSRINCYSHVRYNFFDELRAGTMPSADTGAAPS